jgi:hypothetical protein
MFRFTIREVLLVTALVGTGIGWWLDHRVHAASAGDARLLAHYSVHGCNCGFEAGYFATLQEKYGANRRQGKRIMIVEEDESKLGINLDP